MKYLDEQIIASKTHTSSVSTGLYQYRIKRKVEGTANFDTIFVGSLYHEAGATFSIDITEIIRNDKWVPLYKDLYGTNDGTSVQCNLVNSYCVDFYLSGSSIITSDLIQVAKVFRNPHKLNGITYPNQEMYFDYSVSGLKNIVIPMQGYRHVANTKDYKLIPHYPYINTNNYRMIMVSENASTSNYGTEYFTGSLTGSYAPSWQTPSQYTPTKLSTLYSHASQTVSYYAGYDSVSHQIGNYSITYDNSTYKIQAVEQQQLGYCYFRLLLVDHQNQFVKALSEWQEDGRPVNGSFTIDGGFLELNSSNKVVMIFADYMYDSTDLDDYDFAFLQFNISGYEEQLLGKTVSLAGDFSQPAQGTWKITDLRIVETIDQNQDTFYVIKHNNVNTYAAQIDMQCKAPYYLQWQDRMGGFQSQPFSDRFTYGEQFTTEQIVNYSGEKRNVRIDVQPTFKISSDWIAEEFYPYYESIYTSPILILYDTKQDASYCVNLTDTEYEEKTFKNQKRLFNINLNLELNKSQNIIY